MIKSIFIKQFFILSILTCLIVCSDDTVDPTNNSDGDSNTDGNSGTCGDGVIDTDEACDEGTSNSDTEANACRTNCTIASCGDSVCDTDEDSSTCSNDCPSNITHISLGNYHTCTIRNGELFCWGRNSHGQLGDGTNGVDYNDRSADKNIPTRIGNNSDWTHISSGVYHTCGFRNNNGKLFCWGYNGHGQLGDGTYTDKNTPTRIGNKSDWTHISLGGYHTCGLRNNGQLFCWGNGSSGKLGDGTSTGKNTPVYIENNSDWTHISLGYSHACAINDGELFYWGYTYVTSLSGIILRTPTLVGNKSDWTHISSGGYHTCGMSNNQLFCWGGNNNYGQLGDGTNNSKDDPTHIGVNIDWTHISLGFYHTCGISDNGELFCWGNNEKGQLGDETNVNMNIPNRIGSDSDWTHLELGYNYTCGVRNNQLFCWGRNNFGQLGDGTNGADFDDTNADKNIPTLIEF